MLDLVEGVLTEFAAHTVPSRIPWDRMHTAYGGSVRQYKSRCPHGVGNVKNCGPCRNAAARARYNKVAGVYGLSCA